MQTLLRLWWALEGLPWDRAVAVEWQERFGRDYALLEPHLKPTNALAPTYPCPSGGGDSCPRQVHERDGGGFEAVCGNMPAECPPVRLQKMDLAVRMADYAAVLAPAIGRVRDQESLMATSVAGLAGLLPLGVLERRAGRMLVVLATAQASTERGAALELRRAAGSHGVVVLVAGRRDARVIGEGHAELGIDRPDDLQLWRALQLLWPESWATRATRREAVFEDVSLEFGADRDRHLVLLNGCLLKDFRISDAKFARLVRLAAARWVDPDVEEGGWLRKAPYLQLDHREADLGDLRTAFISDQPDGFAGMRVAERRVLVQSSPDLPGMLRLPLNPRHIRFAPSLKDLRLLGNTQNEPRALTSGKGKRETSSNNELARNRTQARATALKMFEEARKLGVPLPEEEVLRSGSHEI